ncbi:hybrid sensor histidine kinase/response regulator [Agaribacter flavus]|uniref:histidine kinase n=1 Tax=Agaribacter flavus TaxID=1902781 RepID=A0ABV7FP43_9ALTE
MTNFLQRFYIATALMVLSVTSSAVPTNMLIVYHIGNDDKLYQDFENALTDKLNTSVGSPTIFVEHLDLQRFSSVDYEKSVRALVMEKYANIELDIVIFNSVAAAKVFDFEHPLLANAHKFILERRDVSPFLASEYTFNLRLHPDYTKLIDVASRSTNSEHVYLLTPDDRQDSQLERIKQQLSSDAQKVSFIPLINTAQAINALSGLDQRSPLILMSNYSLSDGEILNPMQVARRISRIVNQPVFVAYDSLIFENVVGGHVVSSSLTADFLAEQIKRLLSGYSVDTQIDNVYSDVFNYRALNLQRLSADRLPHAHLILNKPASIFDLFLQELMYIVFVLLILSGLVVFMLYSNRLLRLKQDQLANSQISLQRIHKRMDVATNATQIGIWEFDLETSKLYWDQAMHSHHGMEAERFNQKLSSWLDILNVQDKVQLEALVNECIQTGKSWKLRYSVVVGNTTKYLVCNVAGVKDKNDNVIRLVGTVLNVTDSELHQQRLQEQRIKAEQATKAKSEFLANMSHEIRTPMNGVIGAADLLASTPLSEMQAQYANMIKSSAGGLLHILNDILDLSKIESGKLDIDPAPFELKTLVQQIMSSFTLEIARKKLKFKLHHSSYIPDVVNSDALRIKQVLFNLIGNAIKFTNEGMITLSIEFVPITGDANAGSLQFTVTDTGIGIPKSHQQRIFKSFEQVASNKDYIAKGTGLGLSISKKLAQLMGGDLSLKSEVDEGSAFTLLVPVTVAPKDSLNKLDSNVAIIPNLKAKRILVVDDNDINQTIVGQMLIDCGAHVQYAKDGSKAVSMFKDEHPDLILMDLLMPVMDGIESTKAIRAYEAEKQLPRTKIIALTAHALKGYEESCKAAGMDDYLTKPVNRNELYKACME